MTPMTSTVIVTSVSAIIAWTAVTVAVWLAVSKNNLRRYMRAEVLENHRNLSVLLGTAQGCLSALQANNPGAAIQNAAQTEAHIQSQIERSIRTIYNITHYNRHNVDRWVQDGVVPENYQSGFLRYIE
jgi:hypothetical protein